jgi:hypothetical protein
MLEAKSAPRERPSRRHFLPGGQITSALAYRNRKRTHGSVAHAPIDVHASSGLPDIRTRAEAHLGFLTGFVDVDPRAFDQDGVKIGAMGMKA